MQVQAREKLTAFESEEERSCRETRVLQDRKRERGNMKEEGGN